MRFKLSSLVVALLSNSVKGTIIIQLDGNSHECNLSSQASQIQDLISSEYSAIQVSFQGLDGKNVKYLTPQICSKFDLNCLCDVYVKESGNIIANELSPSCIAAIPPHLFKGQRVEDMHDLSSSFIDSMTIKQFSAISADSLLGMKPNQLSHFFSSTQNNTREKGHLCQVFKNKHVRALQDQSGKNALQKITPECLSFFGKEALGAIGPKIANFPKLFSRLPLKSFLDIKQKVISAEMVKESVTTFSCPDLDNQLLQHLPLETLIKLDAKCWEDASYNDTDPSDPFTINNKIAKNLDPSAFARVNPDFIANIKIEGSIKNAKRLFEKIGSRNNHASCMKIGSLFVQLDKNSIGSLPIESLPFLTTDDISAIHNASTFMAIPPKWISMLDSHQIAGIQPEIFRKMRSSQFTSISVKGCSGLQALQINNMQKNQKALKRLGSSCVANIPVPEILGLDRNIIKKLDASAFSLLSNADFEDSEDLVKFLEMFPAPMLASLNDPRRTSVHLCKNATLDIHRVLSATKIDGETLESFQNNCMPILNPESFNNLTEKDVGKLDTFFAITENPMVIGNLSTSAMEGMSQKVLNSISPRACSGLTLLHLEGLYSKNISLESMECILSMEPKEAAKALTRKLLPKDAIQHFTHNHMKHVKISDISTKNLSMLGHKVCNSMHPCTAVSAKYLTRDILQNISPRCIALLKDFGKMDFEMIRNLNSELFTFIHEEEFAKIKVGIELKGSKIRNVYSSISKTLKK